MHLNANYTKSLLLLLLGLLYFLLTIQAGSKHHYTKVGPNIGVAGGVAVQGAAAATGWPGHYPWPVTRRPLLDNGCGRNKLHP